MKYIITFLALVFYTLGQAQVFSDDFENCTSSNAAWTITEEEVVSGTLDYPTSSAICQSSVGLASSNGADIIAAGGETTARSRTLLFTDVTFTANTDYRISFYRRVTAIQQDDADHLYEDIDGAFRVGVADGLTSSVFPEDLSASDVEELYTEDYTVELSSFSPPEELGVSVYNTSYTDPSYVKISFLYTPAGGTSFDQLYFDIEGLHHDSRTFCIYCGLTDLIVNIDEVSVIDDMCQSEVLHQNTSSLPTVTIASSRIAAGENVDGGATSGPVTVQTTGSVDFISQGTVELEPGFLAPTNSVFTANIDFVCANARHGKAASFNKPKRYDLENYFNIYPNPSKDGMFYFETDQKNIQIEIFDMLGNQVSAKRNNFQLDLGGHKNGVYLLKISSENEVFTKRLMIN